jgi:hypothetical protein
MKKDWSNHKLIVILPLLFVALLYGTEGLVRSSFLLCENNACSESIPGNMWKVLIIDADLGASSSTNSMEGNSAQKAIALKYSSRMNWFFLGEVFLFATIGALAVASVLTFRIFSHHRIFWMLGVLVLSFLFGLFMYANPQFHMTIFSALFGRTIAYDVYAIDVITKFLNSLGNAAIFSLLMTICLTLYPLKREEPQEGIVLLSRRMKFLRLILYTGTFLLITTILHKKSIYQWSLAYISQDEAILSVAREFVLSLLTLEGGFYTMVLAAAYFPAAFVLQRRAQLLIDGSVEETEKEKKLQELGMTFSFRESLPRILAILGPFLTGPIGEFLTGSFF